MTADIAYQRLQAVEAALRALLEAERDEYRVARDTAAHVLEGRSYAEARTIALAFASERTAVRATSGTAGLCGLCGEPLPKGEEMFQYHGYSGPSPTPRPVEIEGSGPEGAPQLGDVIIEGSIALPVEPASVTETPPAPTRVRATRARRGATIADLEVPSAD